MDATALKPYIRTAGTDYSGWNAGGLVTYLATGEDTGGAFGLIDLVVHHGTEPPLHIHNGEEESFYILEGTVTFLVEGRELTLEAGGWAMVPRRTVHTYRVDSGTARMLVLLSPAGFERFFMETSEPATSLTIAPTPDGPPDIARIVSTAEKFGVTFMPAAS
jgi:quercetin dioxygenase-like cupin family protein